MSWALWVIFGVGLLVFEILTPGGFFTVFFGISAFVVAVLVNFGVLESGPAQWLTFVILGTAMILAFRPLLKKKLDGQPSSKVDQIVGETAIALEAFGADARGKVELRGTSWSALCQGPAGVRKGDRLRVIRMDGLNLVVEKEKE
jgi:membrane protein implicated in regulation of membrane protease activity